MNANDFSFALKYASRSAQKLMEAFDANGGQLSPSVKLNLQTGDVYDGRQAYAKSYATGPKGVFRWKSDGSAEARTEEDIWGAAHVERSDWRTAFEYFSRAVKGGSRIALCRIAELYNNGCGVEQDVASGFALLAKAAMSGNDGALGALQCGTYGLDNISGWLNYERLSDFLSDTEKLNLCWIEFIRGTLHFYGLNGEPKDEAKGMQLIKASASRGFWLARRHLALCRFDGVGGEKQDVLSALKVLHGMYYKNWHVCMEEILDRLYLWNTDSFEWMEKAGCGKVLAGVDDETLKSIMCKAAREYSRRYRVDWIHILDETGKTKIMKSFGYRHFWYLGYASTPPEGYLFIGKIGVFRAKGVLLYEPTIDYVTAKDYSRMDFQTFLLNPTEQLTEFWDKVNLHAIGISREELMSFFDYLKRSIFLYRRAGRIRVDGSRQKEEQMESPNDYLGASSPSKSHESDAGRNVGQGKKSEPEQKVERKTVAYSSIKRIQFLIVGLSLGWLGLHFRYARRKNYFRVYCAVVIAYLLAPRHSILWSCCGLVIAWLWIGCSLFMRNDGFKRRMRWFK